MSKGQTRSNREAKKPKKPKAVTRPEATSGNAVKTAVSANFPRSKDKL